MGVSDVITSPLVEWQEHSECLIAGLLRFDRQKTFLPYLLSETCFSIAKTA